jgi:hypothetical protein
MTSTPCHPSHVELLGAEPEVAGVEALRCVNVGHPEIGHDAYGAHAILLPATMYVLISGTWFTACCSPLTVPWFPAGPR